MVSMIAGTQELWSYVCAQAKLWLERFPLIISIIIYWWSEKIGEKSAEKKAAAFLKRIFSLGLWRLLR